jgi:hypothetical protein
MSGGMFSAGPSGLRPASQECFEWHLVREVAKGVARCHHVSPGAVRGYAVVLMVEANWWTGFGPGVTACSVACAQDPRIARDILLDAFESGLTS